MVAHAAAASLGSMQMTAALSRGSVVPSIRRVASVRPAKRLTRARFPVVRAAQDQGPNESTEDYEARLHADATVAQSSPAAAEGGGSPPAEAGSRMGTKPPGER